MDCFECLALGDDNCLKVPEDIDVTDELQVLEDLARWHEESAKTNYTFVSTLAIIAVCMAMAYLTGGVA